MENMIEKNRTCGTQEPKGSKEHGRGDSRQVSSGQRETCAVDRNQANLDQGCRRGEDGAAEGKEGKGSKLKSYEMSCTRDVIAKLPDSAGAGIMEEIRHQQIESKKDFKGCVDKVVDGKIWGVGVNNNADRHAELATLKLGVPGCNVLMLPSKPIATALQCSICREVINNAYKCLECMHSYCYSCMLSKIEVGNPRNVCPVKDCGRHDIDGFTPTFLGPNPFSGLKPKVLPDSLLCGIVKKVFGVGMGLSSQPAGQSSRNVWDVLNIRPPATGKVPQSDNFQASKVSVLNSAVQSRKLVVKREPHLARSATLDLNSNKGIGAQRVKAAVRHTSDRHARKAKACAAAQACPFAGMMPEIGKDSIGRSGGKKRPGSLTSSQPAKRMSYSQQSTAPSDISIGLFPVDALDDVQRLPLLECNYFLLPPSTPLEVLLNFVRSELKNAWMVLYCRDKLLMEDLDKSIEWVRREIWLPRDYNHDVFSLYYSDSTTLPDKHWLREQ